MVPFHKDKDKRKRSGCQVILNIPVDMLTVVLEDIFVPAFELYTIHDV